MTEKNVQLKRDDVVGNEVVSENINPKTDTTSVEDLINGLPLSETQRIMWNAINNKLSRIVNSWNGRTGVVVATKADVGLGNVDNISFSEILRRIEELMMETFGKKRMRLFNNLHEVDQFCDRHNKEEDWVVSGAPFFSVNGYNLDRKSYIGYIFLNEDDPENLKLEHTQLPINLSGWADMSLRWDEEWGVRVRCTVCENIMDWDGKKRESCSRPEECDCPDHQCDRTGCTGRDEDLIPFTDAYNTGRLGINIARQERYLEVYKPVFEPGTILDKIDKDLGGLRIKPGSLYGRFHYFTGMYGDGTAGAPNYNPLLLRTNITDEGAPVTIVLQDLDNNDDRNTPVFIQARLHPDWMWRDQHDSRSLSFNTSGNIKDHYGNKNKQNDDALLNPKDYPDGYNEFDPDRIGGLREGDKIFISMRDYRIGNPPIPPTDMDHRLMFRNDHIGIVSSAPSTWNPLAPYIITLNRIRAKVGWGLQHLNDRSNTENGKESARDSFITIRLARGNVGANITSGDSVTNLSGLQVTKGRHDPDIKGFMTTSEIAHRYRLMNLPTGPHTAFAGNNANRTGGLYINPDASLAIIPHKHYRGGTDIHSTVENWAVNAPGNPQFDETNPNDIHALEQNSFVGINLTKLTYRPGITNRWQVGNASGMRVIDASDSLDIEDFFNVRIHDNHNELNFSTPHGGGVSINAGNFLEIRPSRQSTGYAALGEFNDRGKSHIRVNPDRGLDAWDNIVRNQDILSNAPNADVILSDRNELALKINTARAMYFRRPITRDNTNNDGTPNTYFEGVITSGTAGQLETNIGEIGQSTSFTRRRGLRFWSDFIYPNTNDISRLRIDIGTNEKCPTHDIHNDACEYCLRVTNEHSPDTIRRQRRGLTFASITTKGNGWTDRPSDWSVVYDPKTENMNGVKYDGDDIGRNTEDETRHINSQDRLKIWLHARNGLAFRNVKREYEFDIEEVTKHNAVTGQLGINYQHLLENLARHTGRGIIIRNLNDDGLNPIVNPADWRIETRLVGQNHYKADHAEPEQSMRKSLGLEYGDSVTTVFEPTPGDLYTGPPPDVHPCDPTHKYDGIKVRPWNGLMTNNDESRYGTDYEGRDLYNRAHHGVMARIDPKAALRFKMNFRTDGGGADIPDGLRSIMINIGRHHPIDEHNNVEHRKRQGLTFQNPITDIGAGLNVPMHIRERHDTGEVSGWQDASAKLRIWDNVFRGIEFRGIYKGQPTQWLDSLGTVTNETNNTRRTFSITPSSSVLVWGTPAVVGQVNPRMDPNEQDLVGMLQIKRHGGLRFRFRGDTWQFGTQNQVPFVIVGTGSAVLRNAGYAITPPAERHQHGRIQAQPNRSRGLEVASYTTPSQEIPSTTNIYPDTGSNEGDLQLRINRRTALRFTDDFKHYFRPSSSDQRGGDVQLNDRTRTLETPTVFLPTTNYPIPAASVVVPAFNTSQTIPGMTITPALPTGVTVNFPAHTITVDGNTILNVPERVVTIPDVQITEPGRIIPVARNRARMHATSMTVPQRRIQITRPIPTVSTTLQIVDPVTFEPISPNVLTLAAMDNRDRDIASQIHQVPVVEIPHDQFTEDDRIMIRPQHLEYRSDNFTIERQIIIIPSYTVMLSWQATGSNGITYTITRPVQVTQRTIENIDQVMTVHTIIDLYNESDRYVRVPETDRFEMRDQGRLRLIVDPNQGLGFNPQAFVGTGTIINPADDNPHNWQFNWDRRDINALRVKLNFSRGVQFRTNKPYSGPALHTKHGGTTPLNTYDLTNNFNDESNRSGTAGQIEIKINTRRGLEYRPICQSGHIGYTTGCIHCQETSYSMYGAGNNVGSTTVVPESFDAGQLQVKIDRGLAFITDGSERDGRIRAVQWYWEFTYTGDEEEMWLAGGTYNIIMKGAQGGGNYGSQPSSNGLRRGAKGASFEFIHVEPCSCSPRCVQCNIGHCDACTNPSRCGRRLFVCVGQRGDSNRGGFPFGGNVGPAFSLHDPPSIAPLNYVMLESTIGGYGGGGCSYISLTSKLNDTSLSNLSDALWVAGGGGGASHTSDGNASSFGGGNNGSMGQNTEFEPTHGAGGSGLVGGAPNSSGGNSGSSRAPSGVSVSHTRRGNGLIRITRLH